MKSIIAIFFGISIFLNCFNLYSQGCSDAGFCSVGGMKTTHQVEEIHPTTVSVGTFVGFADNAILVSGGVVDVQHSFSNSFSAGVKVTSLMQSGKQTTQFGLSDVFVNGIWNVDPAFSVIGGIKIPLSSANKTINGRPLPMDYQSSLGTYDAIVGLAFTVNDFQFQVGYQHPLTQNENRFVPFSEAGTTLDFSEFQNTFLYNRSADALFRVSYSVLQNKDWSLMVGVLPIYHLDNDTYLGTVTSGMRKDVIFGSRGFTVNANVFLRYNFSTQSAVEMTLASPFITRSSRPDGLTRSFISSIDYKYSF
ncbi:MAG: hypothetical protein JNL36_10750 [Candidatus Kapabacteria bacterium]|nr:hypothetical protein [Candidatus Kapabacteria bacterium]